jgi:hypothetical protein
MLPLEFRGNATALSADGLAGVAGQLGVGAAEFWTVVGVETSGCGFIADGRPTILYERHIFSRLTNHKFDDGDICDSTPGGYGPLGDHQYDRLQRAIAKDRTAALMSASWGIGQVMGENCKMAGFADVEAMVAAMSDSEDKQAAAMANFLIAKGLQNALRVHDWTSFASGYNGPNFTINRYDVLLNAEFQKCQAGVMPDLNTRATQLYLAYLGFHPGPVDGLGGQRTMAAMADCQRQNGIQLGNSIDGQVVAALSSALPSVFGGAAAAVSEAQSV